MTATKYYRSAGTDGVMLRYAPGDYTTTATFSRASAATYNAANTFNGVVSDLMLRYAPGDSIATATASRASAATFSGRA